MNTRENWNNVVIERLVSGEFAAASEQDEIEELGNMIANGRELLMDERGVLYGSNGNTLGQGNQTTVKNDPFAADIPSNSDQWYNKNPNLFRAEVQYMFQRHPKAVYGFFKQTGNMYWIITLDIIKSGSRPWTFLLQYDKDHPNNDDYGGSIKVQLLKSPSLADIEKRAKAFGRPGVPHLVGSRRVDGERYTYLCTRRPDAVESGVDTATSAVQVAAWAADWAAHFEAGMYNKEVWNEWCNDDHFRHLQI